MADKKISQLTAATTPLAGTEVLPIVQSGSTVKVPVSDLTAGRAVSAATVTTTGNAAVGTTLASWGTGGNTKAVQVSTMTSLFEAFGGSAFASNVYFDGSNDKALATGFSTKIAFDSTSGRIAFASTNASSSAGSNVTFVDRFYSYSDGNLAVPNGNLAFSTAAKGVNFTANTPAAGMTSQLLNWYEGGTWTPALSSNAGSAGAAAISSAYGIYTRIGNQVTISFSFKVDNVGSWSGAIQVAGIPFNFASGKFVIAATAASNLTYTGQIVWEGAVSAGDKLTLRQMASGGAWSQVNVSGISAGNTVLYGTLTYFV